MNWMIELHRKVLVATGIHMANVRQWNQNEQIEQLKEALETQQTRLHRMQKELQFLVSRQQVTSSSSSSFSSFSYHLTLNWKKRKYQFRSFVSDPPFRDTIFFPLIHQSPSHISSAGTEESLKTLEDPSGLFESLQRFCKFQFDNERVMWSNPVKGSLRS